MKPDGQVAGFALRISVVAALEHWEGRQEPESPLAKYSTEEIIAELCRREVNIDRA